MIKTEKGITLAALIIVVILMTMIASTVASLSKERFDINKLQKMYTDIELLQDKVANYYLKYEILPLLMDEDENSVKYTYSTMDEAEGDYYILNLNDMENIALNYGKLGFESPNESDDVYIISKESHIIYYAKGIKLKNETYYTLVTNSAINDQIPPSTPQINVISGNKISGAYTTDVEVEIIAGKDGGSGVKKTEYSIDDGTTWEEFTENRKIITINENGICKIKAKTTDNSDKSSETQLSIYISKATIGAYVNYDISYTDVYTEKHFDAKNGWRYLGTDDEGNKLIISTGIPAILKFEHNETPENDNISITNGASMWWDSNTEGDSVDRAIKGLLENFSSIQYIQEYSYAEVEEVVNDEKIANVAIGRFSGTKIEGTEFSKIGDTFCSATYSIEGKIKNVRTLTLAELNKAVNDVKGTNRDVNCLEEGFKDLEGEAEGLFGLDRIYSYWLATKITENEESGLACISHRTNKVEVSNWDSFGLRPVIVLSSDVQLIDVNKEGVLSIIY